MNPEYLKIYTDFLAEHISLKKPLKIVFDCSSGTEGAVVKSLQARNIPNLELIIINDTPDSDFKSHGPNPLLPGASDQASAKVLETKADFGVIVDADADRAFFVDNTGTMLSSFMIAVLLFKHFKAPYVADEWVYKSLEHMKLFSQEELFPSKVGTRFVKEVLKEKDATVAAEFSGHYYFKDFFGSDSGIFTMLKVASLVSELQESLSDFTTSLPPQYIQNEDISLKESNKTWADIEPHVYVLAESLGAKIETREGITLDTGDTWANMRTSNTEPIVRMVAGGTDKTKISELIQKIRGLV